MDSIHTGQWDRLDAVIKWSGLSIHAFAAEINLRRSENLYRIKNNKNGVSRRLVSMIAERFPEVSDVWLMTGSGEMLTTLKKSSTKIVPYYPFGVNQYLNSPNGNISSFSVPSLIEAEMVVDVMSSSSNGIVPLASQAFLRRVDPKEIISGRVYYIITQHFEDIRQVVLSGSNEQLTLKTVPENSDFTTIIHAEDIIHIFLIVSYFKKL